MSRLFSKNCRVPVMPWYGTDPVSERYQSCPENSAGQIPDRYRSVCHERKNYCKKIEKTRNKMFENEKNKLQGPKHAKMGFLGWSSGKYIFLTPK